MSRRLGLGWRGARFGLSLSQFVTTLIAYLFFIHAAVVLGLTPIVFGKQFFGIIGIGVAIMLAKVFQGVIRRAFVIDADYMRGLLIYAACAIGVCMMTYFSPEPLGHILNTFSGVSLILLYLSVGGMLVGLFYCLTAWGGLLTWLSSLVAFASLCASLMFMLVASKFEWANPLMPEAIKKSVFYENPVPTAILLACLTIYLFGVYLGKVAHYFNDTATQDFVKDFLKFHIMASIAVVLLVYLQARHEPKQVVQLGGVWFDVISISLNAVMTLIIAIDGMRFSRCIAGAKNLVSPYRR